RMENPSQTGQPDRMRSADPQSEHHFVKCLIRPPQCRQSEYEIIPAWTLRKRRNWSISPPPPATSPCSALAALFASAEGSVAATSIEAAHTQALLAHPHTG